MHYAFCIKKESAFGKDAMRYNLKIFGNIIKYILQFLQKWYNIKSGRPKGQYY